MSEDEEAPDEVIRMCALIASVLRDSAETVEVTLERAKIYEAYIRGPE